jgi:pimeloyl-ACP methyl ester carboxylesterase
VSDYKGLILKRFYLEGASAKLSGVVFGEPHLPPLVIIHGMRDHALGLFEVIESLGADYFVIAPDLRGHGHSEKTGIYTMVQFVADVKAVFNHFDISRAVLVGHSLGGHIALRFSATFPELITKLVLLDGLGPPDRQADPVQLAQRFRDGVDLVLSISGERRKISSVSEAVSRLRQNNPQMSSSLALLVVKEGTEPHPEGGVRWRWESAVNMIWHTFSQAESESLFVTVKCPVLVVTGEHSLNYWTAMRPHLNDQDFYEAELARRTKLFRNARHVTIADAGHMLHYDQPLKLLAALRRFID